MYLNGLSFAEIPDNEYLSLFYDLNSQNQNI